MFVLSSDSSGLGELESSKPNLANASGKPNVAGNDFVVGAFVIPAVLKYCTKSGYISANCVSVVQLLIVIAKLSNTFSYSSQSFAN